MIFMHFFELQPEVAGGISSRTKLDRSCHPPLVSHLHYRFDGWLGDELIEGFPVFLATVSLAESFARQSLTGFEVGEVDVEESEQFHDIYPGTRLPPFVWLKVTGRPGVDDFGLSARHRLVVSERALSLMTLAHCDVDTYRAE
jgi:hypothetical protein